MFRNQELAIVGGEDTATEEALYLTKCSSLIHILIRRKNMRAGETLQNRVFKHLNIIIHWNREVVGVLPNDSKLEGTTIRNNQTKKKVERLFDAIYHILINTDLLKERLELNDAGYLFVETGTVQTNLKRVYAAGDDAQNHEYHQAVTAAGTYCIAVLITQRWLSTHNLIQEDEITLKKQENKYQKGSASVTYTAETFNINETRYVGGYVLQKLFHKIEGLIIAKYISPNCGQCHIIKLISNEFIYEYERGIHSIAVDIKINPKIYQNVQVMGTTTVHFLKNKNLLKHINQIKRKNINKYLQAEVK
ncbi:MAG: FAD-dependent oxidoreductase [cyanobacterium endosymbiont of Rhopalodia yunnanensis]